MGPMASSVCARLYRKGRLEADDFDLSEVSEHLATPDSLVWIDMVDPTPDQLVTLADELDLHELAVEDALKARQRPKLDVYDSHTFLATRALRLDLESGTLAETEVHAFSDTRWIVTVRSDDHHDMDVVVRRMANPLFDGYLNRTRSRLGMRVVYDADAVASDPRIESYTTPAADLATPCDLD